MSVAINANVLCEMQAKRAIDRLNEAAKFDTESAHEVADEVLCDLLRELLFDDVVDAWQKVEKWYA